MDVKYVKLEGLTKKTFEPFGEIMGLKEEGELVEDLPYLKYWENNAYLGEINEKLEMGLLINTLDEQRYEFRKFEMHPNTMEFFFPLVGKSVFVMVPPNTDKEFVGIQHEDEIKAFLIDGTLGVGLFKGTWHWPPRPLGEFSKMALLRKGELTEETEYAELGMKVRVIL